MKWDQGFKIKEVVIPAIFKSFITEENFSHCISCEKYLLDDTTEYVIEKVFRDNYVEVEYAMCLDCVDEMRTHMSEESMQRISDYFGKHSDFIHERFNLLLNENVNVNDYISNCLLNNKSIDELKEYQVFAHCRGTKLILSVFPYMISFEIAEEMQELLSAKTKEELDRFTDKHFGFPPELREIFKTKRPVFL